MKVKTKNEVKAKDKAESCIHYWIVGHPKHGYCKAICKYCGERRAFESTFADSRWYGEMPEEFRERVDLQSVEGTTGEFV